MTHQSIGARSAELPDIRRPDAHSVFVNYRYVADAGHGRALLDDISDQWERAPWPEDFLSFSCYLSSDHDAILTYTQCARADTYRPFVRSRARTAQAEPVEYRMRRSIITDAHGAPGCVVVAMFDVDGPDRQEAIIDALSGMLAKNPGGGPTGMLSAHFHTSIDGTRVCNYAEWTSDQDHTDFLDGATRQETLRTSNLLPGVRPIGFRRYNLYRSLSR